MIWVGRLPFTILRRAWRVAIDAFKKFHNDDGWAIASHIALSTLLALFPFLIVVAAMTSFFFGSKELADEAANLLLEAWPEEVAAPISTDIRGVLTEVRGSVFTFGLVFAIYFASSGVESLRIGLNRAYDISEERAIWFLRLESIGYVIVGAVALIAFAFLVVFAPLIWAKLVRYIPGVAPFGELITLVRFTLAATILIIALVIVHLWLPAGRRPFGEVAPGIVVTLLLWLLTGSLFGIYLAGFASTYITMYAGLASAMIALVFLYVCASIFIYGGELNSTICQMRKTGWRTPRKRKMKTT